MKASDPHARAPLAATVRAALRKLPAMARAAWSHFKAADASLLAGAISFFTFLSIAPLAFASVVVVGWAVGFARAQNEVLAVIEDLLGPRGSEAARVLIDDLPAGGGSVWLAAIALAVALVGASRAFVHLQTAFNRVFGVRTRDGDGLKGRARIVARKRGLSVALAGGFGLAVLLSTAAGAVLEALTGSFAPYVVGRVIDSGLSLAVMVGFLALLYRVLPDVELRWREALIGGTVAGAGVVFASKLLGLYLGFAVQSASAAAAAVIVTLLWLQFTGLLVLLGAAFVRAASEAAGLEVTPQAHAVAVQAD